MKKINPNQLIINISKSLRYLTLISIALLIAKIVWWMINPLGYTQVDNPALKSEKSQDFAQAIINRAAFGVYVEEHAETPAINLKVIGVYAAGPKNSVAFLQIDDKHTIASIGDKVLEGTIKAILPTGIIITTNNQDVSVNIGGSNAMSNTAPNSGSTSNQANNSHFNNGSNSPYNNNDAQVKSNSNHEQRNDSSPANNSATAAQTTDNDAGGNAAQNSSGSNNNSDDSIMSKRQKMIQEFQQQNASNQN